MVHIRINVQFLTYFFRIMNLYLTILFLVSATEWIIKLSATFLLRIISFRLFLAKQPNVLIYIKPVLSGLFNSN